MSVLTAAVQGILRSCSVNPLQVLGAATESDIPANLALLWPSQLSDAGVQASAVGPAPTWSYTGDQYDDSGVSVGTVPALHGDKGVWCGPGYTNLFAGDSSIARSVVLTARTYTLWCSSGSVSCSYGTATPSAPLTFVATAGETTFTPTGVTQWQLTATVAPMPYVPPGTTVASAAGTSGGNGVGFELVPDLKECFEKTPGPATCTVAALVTMGVGSGDITPNGIYHTVMTSRNSGTWSTDFGYGKSGSGVGVIISSYDGTAFANINTIEWTRNEQHLKIVQTNALGTQFRVGNKRIGIDTAIQWGTWANFDGSFNPLTHLRLAYGSTVPIWIKAIQSWRKGQVTESDILLQFKTVGVL